MTNHSHLIAYQNIPEPLLTFNPERDDCISIHPLKGLIEYGPYNQKLIGNAFPIIRVATMGPKGTHKIISELINQLKSRQTPQERKEYLIDFPGFKNVFKRDIEINAEINIEISQEQETIVLNADKPYKKLADLFTQLISKIANNKYDFDILYVYLPQNWYPTFECKADEDFDLHDYIKALCVGYGIPTQIIREDKSLQYPCQCSVMWHLGIATYSKITGVPWKLAQMSPDTAYIGMSYALRNNREKSKFVTCCSQVFDAEGSGMEFVAYETSDFRLESRDNPYLSKDEIRRVMSRCLSIYQERNAGKPPKNIVIHKSTEFKEEEVDGCYDALKVCSDIELVQIQQNVHWKAIKVDGNNDIAGYPVNRGTTLRLDNDLLLWTQGDVDISQRGRHFYKEGRGIPEPILLKRFAGHNSWYDSAHSILGLSKMNWNSDSLYDRLPVTLEFAQKLARTIKRMPHLEAKPYQYRFFM